MKLIFYKLDDNGKLMCTGSEVKKLQQNLNAVGYTPALTVDGKCGKKTDAAIRWYQKRFGLEVDGIAGAITCFSVAMMAAVMHQRATVKHDGDWHYKHHTPLSVGVSKHGLTCNDYVSLMLWRAGYTGDKPFMTGHRTKGDFSKLPKNVDKLPDTLTVVDMGRKFDMKKLHTGDVLILNQAKSGKYKEKSSTTIFINDGGKFLNAGAQSEVQIHKCFGGPTDHITAFWKKYGVTCVIRGK